MNKKDVSEENNWIKDSNKAIKKTGFVFAKDKSGRELILEWTKTDLISSEYADTMKKAWPVAQDAYTSVETEFLKSFPEVVGKEMAFKSFELLFADGIEKVDWTKVENKMKEHLKHIFFFDFSGCSDEIKTRLKASTHVFVSIKSKESNELLGFISFLITPEYAYGDTKCIAFAVKQDEENKGLGKLLMSSAFKIIPKLERIFLCTRITNKNAQRAYLNWGFEKDLDPVVEEHTYTFDFNHWIFFEYKTDKSDKLQKVANTFTNI